MNKTAIKTQANSGFSLVELAIVLIIVALLSGGMLVSLTTSRDIALAGDTQRQLANINDALLGFAAANGRLPCPASPASSGAESFCTNDHTQPCDPPLAPVTTTPQPHGRCRNPYDGFVPAKSLGILPTDSAGFAVDPWNNRIRYSIIPVRNWNAGSLDFDGPNSVFTSTQEIKDAWAGTAKKLPSNNNPSRMLYVCNTAANPIGADDTARCENLAATVADNAVAVIFSRGPNGAAVPVSANEVENGDNDRMFVSVTNSPTFDDTVSWLSPNLLYNRMISSGRLP